MNNTEKLDDTRRLRVTDVRMAVTQPAAVVIFERATGRPVFSFRHRAALTSIVN